MSEQNHSKIQSEKPARRTYVPAVGPRLGKLLAVVFGLFALLSVNALYLGSTTLTEWWTGQVYQSWFYLIMVLFHLVLGALFIVPVLVFGIIHLRNAWHRRNRRAVRMGASLFCVVVLILISGIILTRIEGLLVINDPLIRQTAYWVHVISPIAAAWLFVLHRLAGRKIRWKIGFRWGMAALGFALVMLVVQSQDPRQWNVEGNPKGEQYFFPSLARTLTGDFIPAQVLQNDGYCLQCHADVHETWSQSMHRFSSFNNPPYLFSVRETREMGLERDGSVQASRFCAGCHDPVPFFSGRFDDPDFDDVSDPTAHAGITCTVCHSISHINSVRGNADYTIDEPVHYPFAFSENRALQWTNRQLILAKPAFHRKTFLKPLHQTTEFCGTCHKVHLPVEVNNYKWLRGQNHYDSFLLSGVSGHGVASFYYPPEAEPNCNECHMPVFASDDFGGKIRDDSGRPTVRNHLFPSANTAIPVLVDMPDALEVVKAHQDFLDGVMRVDLFGVREGGTIEGKLLAPLRPDVPELEPGREYLVQIVIRTVKMGHPFTQGTSDSNEVWLHVEAATDSGEVIGRSGGMDPEGRVDPWSHFVNVYMLDRDGNRIDRRNPQDIFIPLYNHQIPPGAADTVHYRLRAPHGAEAVKVQVALNYRKFDTTYMKHVFGDDYVNRLPVTELARDEVTFPVRGGSGAPVNEPLEIPEWMRWNDYGIGLLLKERTGQLRQAHEAFSRVEELGSPEGPLNLARVYLREGQVQSHAPAALARAKEFTDPAPNAWTLLWLTGLVNKQNARYEEAARNFREIIEGGFEQARGRGFDFSLDYRLLNELAQTLYLIGLQHPRGSEERERHFSESVEWFDRVLELEPEDLTAHWGLRQIYRVLGNPEKERFHAAQHMKYRPDDNARDRAIRLAREMDPAADHAAEAVVIFDLHREGAYPIQDPLPDYTDTTRTQAAGATRLFSTAEER